MFFSVLRPVTCDTGAYMSRVTKILFGFNQSSSHTNFFFFVTASYRILPHSTASYIILPHSTDWGVVIR